MAARVFTRFIHYRYMTIADINSKIFLPNVFHQPITNVRLCQTKSLVESTIEEFTNFDDDNTSSKKKISKAMRIYLERARQHDELMKKEIAAYNIGKRHLANMMGKSIEEFTEEDINRSLRYLFPSGLFDHRARPIMKHPDDLYPPRREAEFDETGRPHHFLFYTIRKHYYNSLYDCMDMYHKLNEIEDEHINAGRLPGPSDKLDLSNTKWISKVELSDHIKEKVRESHYHYFIKTLEKLADHPYSIRAKDFLKPYYIELAAVAEKPLSPILYDAQNRPYITVPHCTRKSSRGTVTVRGNGTGKITINNQDILYFDNVQYREQIIFPLIFTDMHDKVDVEATVTGGGPNGQSGCVRWGIAWALRSMVSEEMRTKMKIAGLLTRDWRKRERKKWGQEGARRKFTWKKR